MPSVAVGDDGKLRYKVFISACAPDDEFGVVL